MEVGDSTGFQVYFSLCIGVYVYMCVYKKTAERTRTVEQKDAKGEFEIITLSAWEGPTNLLKG